MNIRRTLVIALAIAGLGLLDACEHSDVLSPTSVSSSAENSDAVVISDSNGLVPEKEINHRAKNFLDNFERTHPEYGALDYVYGSDENLPILLVVVAEHKRTGISSHLFIVDQSSWGRVGLAGGLFSRYRENDGLRLDGNTICISLNVYTSEKEYEIHDYQLTVTQTETMGMPNTVYASKETIREESYSQ